jgi:alpha-L-arabinofuranosidase
MANQISFPLYGLSQMKPEKWTADTVDAIDTGTKDGRRIVLKAVNYAGNANTLLARLQGTGVPTKASVTVSTVSAGLTDENSLAKPDVIKVVERMIPLTRDIAIPLPAYTVAVIEIKGD